MNQLTALPQAWSNIRKIFFRFGFIFFILYIIFNDSGIVPYGDDFFNFYIQPFHRFIVWAGEHILHLPYPITHFTYASGDTTYDYLMLAFTVLLGIVGTIIWTLMDRQRNSYQTLHYWLVTIVRYYVACTMLNYGLAKLFMEQFVAPSPGRLLQTYGHHLPWDWRGRSSDTPAPIIVL